MQSTFDPKTTAHIGLVGLGVMGRNLAANILEKEFQVSLCEVNDALRSAAETEGLNCCQNLEALIETTHSPRCILLFIKAGRPVDAVLQQLLELMSPGDSVIDLGNSHFEDTARRCETAAEKGMFFVGCGTSGGAEGARHGPSMMPGGDERAWPQLKPVFEAIAAKHNGTPCVSWVGPQGAGHFVKMIHNGIEYADMQLIAEAYHLLSANGLNAARISQIFSQWNQGSLQSFLIEATASVLAFNQSGCPLVEQILDAAGQKGTGAWSSEVALKLGVPASMITEAVYARGLSSRKQARLDLANTFSSVNSRSSVCYSDSEFVKHLGNALHVARICNFSQGFSLIEQASKHNDWQIDFGQLASNWRAGCIIRGKLLDDIVSAFEAGFTHSLLNAPVLSDTIIAHVDSLRTVIKAGIDQAVPVPVLGAALAYFDSMRCAQLPANLIQAQRDFFGAHTYERIDSPRGEFFHTDWQKK